MTKQDPDQRSPEEVARLRDETIRRMIKMAPTKHADEPKKPRVKKREPQKPLDPWRMPWSRN